MQGRKRGLGWYFGNRVIDAILKMHVGDKVGMLVPTELKYCGKLQRNRGWTVFVCVVYVLIKV